MNGAIKFHPAGSPAFNAGEVWVSSSGAQVTIINSVRTGFGKFDAEITYETEDGEQNSKGCWDFQVRYNHQADQHARL